MSAAALVATAVSLLLLSNGTGTAPSRMVLAAGLLWSGLLPPLGHLPPGAGALIAASAMLWTMSQILPQREMLCHAAVLLLTGSAVLLAL